MEGPIPPPPPPPRNEFSVKYCTGNLAISKITSCTEWKGKKQQLKAFNDPFPVGRTGLTNKEIAKKDKKTDTVDIKKYILQINANKVGAYIPTTPFYKRIWVFVYTLQRQNAENLKQIFPEKEYRGLSPNFHIHVSVSELYIPTMGRPVLLEEICRLILGILYI
jgi:hypothetical protein